MRSRSKIQKPDGSTSSDDKKKLERSSSQWLWIIVLFVIIGFFLYAGERRDMMLIQVREFLGIPEAARIVHEAEKLVVSATYNNGTVIESKSIATTVKANPEVATKEGVDELAEFEEYPSIGKVEESSTAEVKESSTGEVGNVCQWREDELVGRCFGLQRQSGTFPTRESCEKHCCEMGEECITYQWRLDKGCFVGDIVRLGSEAAPTGNWCEPTKPAEWLGKRLESVPHETSTCTFGEENLGGQCYGLGVQKPPKTPEGCEKLCCETMKCTVWQFRADKGCFVGKSKNCDRDVKSWTGRRKPTPEWRKKHRKRPKDL